MTPDSVYFDVGSQDDREFIRRQAIVQKQEAPLPIEGHTIHFDLPQEQGRIIDRTCYLAREDQKVNSLANRMNNIEGTREAERKLRGIAAGRILFVQFISRGPVGSPVSNPALEITTSPYVAHSANILYRNAFEHFDEIVKKAGHFFTNYHSEGKNRPEDLPEARVMMDIHDIKNLKTFSMLCTYAGNTLLLKKGNHRFAIERAIELKTGTELAEHMFITGIISQDGSRTGIVGAAPSGCGKTTTAMAGDFFVGDDLAQMWIAGDGTVRAVNPECGIFGIVEDVNWEGDPKLMEALRKPGHEVIWSNVLIDENGVPRWVGDGESPPAKGINFQGQWYQGKVDANGKPIPMSHPNARCTISCTALPNYDHDTAEDPSGLLVRIVTYSGRDADTMPPVWVAKNSTEGVMIGASIVSKATATEVGATGVKRAPWANAPFIPSSLGKYMDAQFRFFGSPMIKRPLTMAGLNYFLTDQNRGGTQNKLLGEKRDVRAWLNWLVRFDRGEVGAIETPVGYIPKYEDLETLFRNLVGKQYSEALYIKQFSLYIENIVKRIELQESAYGKEENVPRKAFEVYMQQKSELLVLKGRKGAIVSPFEL
jgi:phosphoenolpyruvate carboxykinase (GTP)